MFNGIINLFSEIIETILNGAFLIYENVMPNNIKSIFTETGFNIYIFSGGWFTEPIPLDILFSYILFILLMVFLVRLLWKGTKKFIKLVMGVFKL